MSKPKPLSYTLDRVCRGVGSAKEGEVIRQHVADLEQRLAVAVEALRFVNDYDCRCGFVGPCGCGAYMQEEADEALSRINGKREGGEG